MPENKTPEVKKSFSVDWLVQGTLTRIGDIFDRLTGRSWKPSSSLATSELTERLKKLLDAEVKDLGKKGKFVPHNLKLKMQWDKFSTDSEDALKKLEYELLTAVIDHINDNRYHTYAPLKFEIKPDYFTEGVKLLASFGKFEEEEQDVEMNVTMTNLNNIVIPTAIEPPKIIEEKEVYIARFTTGGKPKSVELAFSKGDRLIVGRTKENALSIDDASVSKVHAAFVLNSESRLMLADTGSTNGTFIDGKRIAYGKAFPVAGGDKVKFGTVEVAIEYAPREVVEEVPVAEVAPQTNSAIATERMLTEEEYLSRQNETIAAKTEIVEATDQQTAAPTAAIPREDISVAKTLVKEEIPAGEKPSETDSSQTGQRIVYDFGENK